MIIIKNLRPYFREHAGIMKIIARNKAPKEATNTDPINLSQSISPWMNPKLVSVKQSL